MVYPSYNPSWRTGKYHFVSCVHVCLTFLTACHHSDSWYFRWRWCCWSSRCLPSTKNHWEQHQGLPQCLVDLEQRVYFGLGVLLWRGESLASLCCDEGLGCPAFDAFTKYARCVLSSMPVTGRKVGGNTCIAQFTAVWEWRTWRISPTPIDLQDHEECFMVLSTDQGTHTPRVFQPHIHRLSIKPCKARSRAELCRALFLLVEFFGFLHVQSIEGKVLQGVPTRLHRCEAAMEGA